MILSKADYKEYLRADAAVNCSNKRWLDRLNLSITWKYLKCMRRLEYILNCKRKNIFNRFRCLYNKYKLYKLSVKSSISIPPNTFGKGLYIPHHGTIVVNPSARFGDNCVIQCGVNISADVVGGDHIFFATGCKIIMGIQISDDSIIGANAVVTKDIDEPNIVVAGVPAKKISNKGHKDRIDV